MQCIYFFFKHKKLGFIILPIKFQNIGKGMTVKYTRQSMKHSIGKFKWKFGEGKNICKTHTLKCINSADSNHQCHLISEK